MFAQQQQSDLRLCRDSFPPSGSIWDLQFAVGSRVPRPARNPGSGWHTRRNLLSTVDIFHINLVQVIFFFFFSLPLFRLPYIIGTMYILRLALGQHISRKQSVHEN